MDLQGIREKKNIHKISSSIGPLGKNQFITVSIDA
jgi:hypothetical protein